MLDKKLCGERDNEKQQGEERNGWSVTGKLKSRKKRNKEN